MKKYAHLSLAALVVVLSLGFILSDHKRELNKTPALHLIPAVQELSFTEGAAFRWRPNMAILSDSMFAKEAQYLQALLSTSLKQAISLELTSAERRHGKGIFLKWAALPAEKEAYFLEFNSERAQITAASKAGMMRGIQTLRQLFKPEFSPLDTEKAFEVPALRIKDAPHFAHRGLLLDVCRHFFSVETIKKQIDLLALYRMNVLHLHLTEDQAWRMEMKSFPKLHEVGAWRREADGSVYGGFYTQAQLREIVAYAAERHVEVIPEIELPGHAQAALAAYPQFSCLGADADISVANDWGVFKEIYCAGNDSTFLFLEAILREVMAIFPSYYIHIGGDEAPKFRWEHCKKCQKRIKQEKLADEHELQSYFIRRIEGFLNQNGRALIGWDEILEGGLSPTATVQSWRGMEGGLAAVKAGNKAIMSPTSHCYLDYGLQQIDLQKVYAFDPIPPGLKAEEQKSILGGEGNMWTEHVPNEKVLDQMIHPRIQALAEVLWTYPAVRDFEDFYQRIQHHYPSLEQLGINYGPETVPATIYADVFPDSNKVMIGALRNLKDLDLEVRWNGKAGPWGFQLKEAGKLSVKAFKNGRPYGDSIQQDFAFHRGLAAVIDYDEPYSRYYPAGGNFALLNGRRGSLNFRDGQWQGFAGVDASFTIQLDSLQAIDSIATNFYHYNNAWIFVPKKVQVEYSEDGKRWRLFGEAKPNLAPETRGRHIERMLLKHPCKARFLRLKVKSQGKVPAWHEAAGSEAWIFIDEIEVY